jgi:hypothetical protein
LLFCFFKVILTLFPYSLQQAGKNSKRTANYKKVLRLNSEQTIAVAVETLRDSGFISLFEKRGM